jgi:hypothetical protein
LTELYDLNADLGEEKNVADQHPEVVKELLEQMKNSRIENPVFPFIEKMLN